MIDAIATSSGALMFSNEAGRDNPCQAALRLSDQPKIRIVHDDVDVKQLELRSDRELFDQELEIIVLDSATIRATSAARTPSVAGNVHPSGPACPALIQLRGR